jgi:hypothetical protein
MTMKSGTWIGLGAALILANMATLTAQAAETCPHLGLLADASRLTDFEGTTSAQFRATLGGEALQCVVKDGVAHTRLKFKVTGNLQTGAKSDTRKVPYFVAVMQGSQVLAKQVYLLDIPFTGHERNVSVEERVNRVDIPLASGKAAGDYEVMIGFQLTREQVAYNRQTGER